jgi:hypothetical protein
MIHFAGIDVQIGQLIRQRCSWCGAVLADYNLALVAVPIGQPGPPAMWPAGALVEMEGNAAWIVDQPEGELIGTPRGLPAGTCADIEMAVSGSGQVD